MQASPIKTRLTELLGLRYPIIQGGMVWVSGWRLAAAVSQAGGLGLIGASSMDPDLLRHHIARLREACPEQPWGVNIPIFYKHSADNFQVCIDEGVRIMVTSGGSPRSYTAACKQAGMKVLHVCATPALAVKCEAAGVDAVIVEGFEAGGHNGRDELATMALVPQAVDAVQLPVVAAGGIHDGRGLAAVLALGAAGAQLGSAFVVARESSAHPDFQRAVCEAPATATRLILRRLVPVRALDNEWSRRVQAAEQAGASEPELKALLGQGRSRRGMFAGELDEGELEIGQIAGALKVVEPAGAIIERIIGGYHATIARLPT